MASALPPRAGEIFLEVFDLRGAERELALDEGCGGDAELRAAVARLLDLDAREGDLFEEQEFAGGGPLMPSLQGASGASPELGMPEQIGRYRILRKLGEGGMGTVFEAEQDHPRRRVALKMIRPGVLSTGLLKRFEHEAQILGRLQHPGIAQIHEAGSSETEAGSQPYFAMEYVDGVQLNRYAEQRVLGTAERLELVARIADAVHHAHQKGVIHRDLKPDNILVTGQSATTSIGSQSRFARLGQPKVLDFGVARATNSDVMVTTMHTSVGQLVGTLPYMSPEQVAGDSRDLDVRSDIHALGIILYQLLSGRLPYELGGKSVPEAGRIIREEEPTRLGSVDTKFRGDIDTIVGMALEKDRERRYASAAELAADIRRHLADQPITAHPPSSFYAFRKFASRNRGLVSGAVFSLVTLLVAVVALSFFAAKAREGERTARESDARTQATAYRLALAAAEATVERDPNRALEHLAEVPVEQRGWEWNHVRAMLAPVISRCEGDGEALYAATTARATDGALLGLLMRGGGMDLVDLETRETRTRLAPGGEWSAPGLAADASRLAAFSASEERVVVWDLGNTTRVQEFPFQAAEEVVTYLSPDGSLLAVTSHERGLFVFDVSTGRTLFRVEEEVPGSLDPVAFDPQSTRVAVNRCRYSALVEQTLYSLSGEVLASQKTEEGCTSLAFSPDGRKLAMGCERHPVRLLDASTLDVIAQLRGHTGAVDAVAFSPDGKTLVSNSVNGIARLWDLTDHEEARVLPSGQATSLTFSADGGRVGFGGAGEAGLIDLEHGPRTTLGHFESYAYSVAFSPDGSLIAAADFLFRGGLWDVATGDFLASPSSHRWAVNFDAEGTHLVSGIEPRRIIDLAAPQHFIEVETPSEPVALWLSLARKVARGSNGNPHGHGQALATSRSAGCLAVKAEKYGDGNVLVLDIQSGDLLADLPRAGRHVTALAVSPDGTRLLVGSKDGDIRLFEVDGLTQLASRTAHRREVLCADYSPDGRRLATGGFDGSIVLWDAENLERVFVLYGHDSYVTDLQFSPDGTRLVSVSGDSSVRLWDSVSPELRHEQARDARHLDAEMAPRVTRLLDELGDPVAVMETVRADPTLTDTQRRAALRVTLTESLAGR